MVKKIMESADLNDFNGVSDTSGRALVDHWKWAADKGLMNGNSAGALRAACVQVLGVLDGWETLDVRAIDVEDVYRRFQNLRGRDFKPESLATYRRRFEQALKLFLEYTADPSGWRAPARESSSRRGKEKKERTGATNGADATDVIATPAPQLIPDRATFASGLVDYPFPLREGRFAYLRLPVDLTATDVRRLNTYLNSLVIEPEAAIVSSE